MTGSLLDLRRCLHSHDSLLSGAYEYGDANRGLKYTAISRTILSDENGHRRARDEDASR
jgi:hypothetical protein